MILCLISTGAIAQPPQFKTYIYIEKYSERAIEQMVEYKIPASVIMAQAIFESRSGTSALAQKANNHFGIKCHIQWAGDTILKSDDTLNECFRRYDRIEDSYRDHSIFLSSRPRYAELFKLPINDYVSWCKGLKNAGYATSPSYADQLIKLIEDLDLHGLDGYEYLRSGLFFEPRKEELKKSAFETAQASLKDFSKHELLWLDEKHTLIQSLKLIVESPQPDEPEIAGR
jgi:flagellum-specific peptidoglycan hydrolase FlgJ